MPEPRLPKIVKPYNPKDANPCSGCSNCCEYLALEIDEPTSAKDFDSILWYVIHKDVWVYVDNEGDWCIQFNTPCEKLKDQRCNYYAHRPNICREYQPDSCPRYCSDPAEEKIFKNEYDLFEYLANERPRIFQRMYKQSTVPEHIYSELVVENQSKKKGRKRDGRQKGSKIKNAQSK